jgi:tetratricopeptide (TPR) repeat protein
MAISRSADLHELERWFQAVLAEADRLLPDLLDLPASVLRQQLRARPELRTAGVVQRLTETAHAALDRYPLRARELTSIAVEQADSLSLPEAARTLAHQLQGLAWREHASALLGLLETDEAQRAIDLARSSFGRMWAGERYQATVDLIESGMLHDLGRRDEALLLVRRAAAVFATVSANEHYIEARMLEARMLREAGDQRACTEVWRATVDMAMQRGDGILMARFESWIGELELREGDPAEAGEFFFAALTVFDEAGLKAAATRARRGLAEAAAARGRIHEAISEFYKVRAELLAAGSVIDAAIVSCKILALLLERGRQGELIALAHTLVGTFCEAGMTQGALEAFTYLRSRTSGDENRLTSDDVVAVRRYFEDLGQRPNARFVIPE